MGVKVNDEVGRSDGMAVAPVGSHGRDEGVGPGGAEGVGLHPVLVHHAFSLVVNPRHIEQTRPQFIVLIVGLFLLQDRLVVGGQQLFAWRVEVPQHFRGVMHG